jgi:hypothetical protein
MNGFTDFFSRCPVAQAGAVPKGAEGGRATRRANRFTTHNRVPCAPTARLLHVFVVIYAQKTALGCGSLLDVLPGCCVVRPVPRSQLDRGDTVASLNDKSIRALAFRPITAVTTSLHELKRAVALLQCVNSRRACQQMRLAAQTPWWSLVHRSWLREPQQSRSGLPRRT